MILLFFVGIMILFLGYKFYSPFVLKQFNLDENMQTPAHAKNDGVDFIPINSKKNMLVQLLNIAGTGPIFGPIMGALFGPIALILIPIGNIVAGSVMDLGFGVLSLKNGGSNLPILAKKYIGKWSLYIITAFTLLLLILVGTVFVVTPVNLIASSFNMAEHTTLITGLIFVYYIIATLVPIDKIAARFYPYCTIILLIGTCLTLFGTLFLIFTGDVTLPALDGNLFTWHPAGTALIPGFIVAVSCGFISGFHTTQTPIVAKTLDSSKDTRKTFYGMMVLEGAIAMVWAFASLALFTPEGLLSTIQEGTQSLVVNNVANTTLGFFAPILIIIIIIFPITSGDTAFRSLRSNIAELFNINQSKVTSRLLVSLPIFGASIFLMTIGFETLWSYFTWANHMVAILSLLLVTGYLKHLGTNYLVTLVPAVILFFLNTMYILTDRQIGAGLSFTHGAIGSAVIAILGTYFLLKNSKSWRGDDLD